MKLLERLSGFSGELAEDSHTRTTYARDTSIFERLPSLVAFPKNADDVTCLVKAVRKAKEAGEDVSLTARSAGTDMSGGPLTRSVVAVFTKHMNRVLEVAREGTGGYGVVEPGCYYRDFEKVAHEKNLLLPSYPASKSIAAMGGIVNNNSGGERTLKYGKTAHYIEEVDVVLSDGTKTTFKELGPDELLQKKALPGLEGDIY